MAKNSLHYKYFKTCVNLYKEQATLILMGNVHLNLVFFFSILCFNLLICQSSHKGSTNSKMFNPSFFVIRNWQYQVIDLALTQSPSSWLKRRSYTQDNLYLWKIKTFIFWNTSTKSMFWKKGKDGWSLTKPRDGNEDFVSKWPRNNKSCARINNWKKYSSRKIFTSFITTILSNFAQRHYLPKTNKKMWKFQRKLDRRAKITQTYDFNVECNEPMKIAMKNAQKRCSEK